MLAFKKKKSKEAVCSLWHLKIMGELIFLYSFCLFRSCDVLYWEHVKEKMAEKVTHGSNITGPKNTHPGSRGDFMEVLLKLTHCSFLFPICSHLLPLVGEPVVERCTPSLFLDGVSIMSVLFHSDFLSSIVVLHCQCVHSDSTHILSAALHWPLLKTLTQALLSVRLSVPLNCNSAELPKCQLVLLHNMT